MDWRTSEGDQRGVRSGGGSHKAVVRKESENTQGYQSCQLNDKDVGMDEDKEEPTFIPSAVSKTAGWHAPKVMCDRQCHKESFQVQRHRVSDGGRRRRAAHDEPFRGLSHCEARREGAEATPQIHGRKVQSLRRDREASCRLVWVHVAWKVKILEIHAAKKSCAKSLSKRSCGGIESGSNVGH